MTTQREIARRAKTSLKTVSRVINRDPLVNAKTRARIEAIIAEIGYEPHQAARMMRSQRSGIIGFLADEVATTSSSIELIRGAQDAAWATRKQMMLFNIERGGESEKLAEAQLTAFRAEAVVYAARYHQPIEIGPKAVPYVLLNCFDPEDRHTAFVPDDYQLGHDVTKAMFARGYRRPVFLNLHGVFVAAQLRARGFIDAGKSLGFDLVPHVYPGADEHGFIANRVLPGLMAGPNRPDIILCGQDILAMEAYFVLAEHGYVVGRDVAVASFDNLEPIASLLHPGLSTIELPYYEMGYAAMQAAIDPPPGKPIRHKLTGRLVERASF
jgi:LacI family transcriptional regulator